LYVWMSLPRHVDTGFEGSLFQQAASREQVMYVPGEVCYGGPPQSRPRNQMRLSYGTQSAAGIDEGMRRLASAVTHVLAAQ
jgi:2-aminoadipate transaminase